MAHRIYQVDAFTTEPFKGNPAGVCLLDGPVEASWMAAMAGELNKPATAFLIQQGGRWHLRWFTPAMEITLCGHATLASAHILWEQGIASGDRIEFETAGGLLGAQRDGTRIALDFPAEPPVDAAPDRAAVEEVLAGTRVVWVGRNRLDVFAVLEDESAVRNAAPDLTRLAAIETRGLAITARSSVPEYDFISRFFAPRLGLTEDLVTGSAHCALGPYWAAKLGRQELSAYQASRRGGELGVRVAGDRVHLSGRAITVMSGLLEGEGSPSQQ